MYIEETGAGDGDVKITVAGEEYVAEANYDLDGDGVDETVAVLAGDGVVAYSDEDSDGVVEVMRSVDAAGRVVSQAGFSEDSGQWVAQRPDQDWGRDSGESSGGSSLVVDTPEGDQRVGPATEDTDRDGRPDTAVVSTEDGTMLVTDVDGDGSADQVVRIDDAGGVTISHHTGAGEWTVVEQGRVDQRGQYTPDPRGPGGRTDDAAWNLDDDPSTPTT